MTETTEPRQSTLELANAYEAVFGQDGKRTLFQQKVWDHLEHECYFRRKLVVVDSRNRSDMEHTAVREGRRQIFLEILSKLELAENGLKKTTENQVKK